MDIISRVSRESQDIKETVAVYEAMERLYLNKDFQKVILEGYLKDRAVKGTKAIADVAGEERQGVVEELLAVGKLSEYFETIKINGEIALQSQIDEEE